MPFERWCVVADCVKLVYLYELDSVRKSEKEIATGQAALFEELVHNGNAVVLTFNQLVDSQAFLAALENEDSFQIIMKLFEIGILKVSPYSGKRTASQYVQDAMGEDNYFVFSALPLRFDSCGELANKLRNAIRYGDIQGLEDEISSSQDVEYIDRVRFLIRFVKLVLLLSTSKFSHNPEKTPADVKYQFMHFMNAILDSGKDKCCFLSDIGGHFDMAIDILKQIRENSFIGSENKNSRSLWYKKLRCTQGNENLHLAIAIVDLCYNYCTEESIYNVSKHYVDLGDESFWRDFRKRLSRYWRDKDAKGHRFCAEDDEDVIPNYDVVSLPRWNSVNWLLKVFQKRSASAAEARCAVEMYEHNCGEYCKQWRRQRLGWLVRCFAVLSAYLILFVVINIGLDFLNGLFDSAAAILVPDWLLPCISIVVFGVVSNAAEKLLKIPDLIDCINDIGKTVLGWLRIKRSEQGIAYTAAGLKDETR
jgi:hypothetical protein